MTTALEDYQDVIEGLLTMSKGAEQLARALEREGHVNEAFEIRGIAAFCGGLLRDRMAETAP